MKKIAFILLFTLFFIGEVIAGPMDSTQAYKLNFPSAMFEEYDYSTTYTGNYLICYKKDQSHYDVDPAQYNIADIYDVDTGKLINTIDLYQTMDPNNPDSISLDAITSYGNLCFFKFFSSNYTSGAYQLINLKNGEVLWMMIAEYSLPRYYYFSFLMDNDKIVLYGNYETLNPETNSKEYQGVISLYYYKQGIFEEPSLIQDNTILNNDQWAYGYLCESNKNFIALHYKSEIETDGQNDGIAIFNINNKSIHLVPDASYFYMIQDKGFLTNDGHIIRIEFDSEIYNDEGCTEWREQIIKINSFTGEKTVLHEDTIVGDLIYSSNGKHQPSSFIRDLSYDSSTGHIYFFENIGTPTTVNRITRKDEYVETTNSEGETQSTVKTTFETKAEPAYAANGQPLLYAYDIESNRLSSYIKSYHKYNLFRITDTGSEPVALSNDFFYTAEGLSLFAKNGTLLIKTAISAHDSISFPEAAFTIDTNCMSNINEYFCDACECTSLTLLPEVYPDVTYKYAVVANASSLSTYAYNPLIIVEPVVPAKADGSSKTKEGAEYIRTYKLKAPDGSPLQNASVTSSTGLNSTSNKEGIVGVRNIALDAAGTYSGKTINDVITSISYNGKNYSFYFRPKYGEYDSFELIIEPGGVFEKRYDLELGGSLSAGVGAFRFGTIKAATIDLEASAASGIYFNIIDNQGSRSMEMGRNLNAGLGANAVLAEADLKGGFSAGAGASLNLMAIGAQSFLVDDPFEDTNTKARSVTTAFIWDTLVKNGTLAFPSIGLIINWIWDNIKSSDLNASMSLQSAGLQVGGEASAGIDIPALEIASGGSELAGSNLSNLGLSLPSISGGFVIEGLLHQFKSSNTNENIGLEVSLTTEMSINTGIFSGVYNFTDLPELPAGRKSTFGLMASFDSGDNPHTLYLNYMTEQESGDRIKVSETELDLDATQLLANVSFLPSTLQKISQREGIGSLSWDTKSLQSLYRQTIHAAGKGVSGNFTTFTDMVDDTTYEFEIGFGIGLNFGVGAHLSYLEHERSKQKSYKIDDIAEGMALVEDWSNTTPRFPSQTFGNIMTLTLEYLKDRVKEIYTTVVEKVESGVDTVVSSGKAVLRFVGLTKSKSTETPYQIALTTFVPLSSEQESSSKSIPKTTLAALRQFAALDTTSASVGEAALVNVMDQDNNLIDEFSAATLSLTYTNDDLTKAGLTESNESDLFMWQFRSSDRKHAKLSGYTLDTSTNTLSYTNVTTNSVFGIGFDNVAPDVTYKYPEQNSTISSDKGIFWKLSDDFSGIDFNSITIKLDGSTIVDGSNIEEYFNPANGFLLVDRTFETGDHVLTISMKDTAGNSFADSVAFGVGTQNSSDFDNDGVPNYQDKFPLDPNYWQDDDNDGIPDSEDTDITSSKKTCSCGNLKANPTEIIDFKNCFGTFEGLVMTLHNIAVNVDGEYLYFWLDTVYDAQNGGFVFNGNFGQETDLDDIDCSCGLRSNTNNDILSLENAYIEFNYNNRLTLHDIAIQNDAGEYNYYWLNFSIDLSTLNFIAMDEFNLEVEQ